METAQQKNSRIAKNTSYLYLRSLVTMLIALYTSRIVLRALGVDDYGVYNVVGGFIAMSAIVTGPVSGAISRFLTYGLGKGDRKHLRSVFSTAICIQLCLGAIVVLLGETVGLWFLTHELKIPPASMTGAHWVLQCSIVAMVLNLINVPYQAAVIAHEKMNVFAYVSVLESVMKLGVAFILMAAPSSRLAIYSVGLMLISLILRIIYGVYCSRKFEECKFKLSFERSMAKELTAFAWWTFLGNTAYMFNTQGASILMNIFFGVVINTAKGIAMQVETAVMQFVNSFTTAFTPQITKSYAQGDKEYMFQLMCRGSKFAVFLLMFFLIPLEFEAPVVLDLWLDEVPEYSVLFVRLSLICSAVMMMGNPFYQGIMATGNIRAFQISVTCVSVWVFPLTWLAYRLGMEPEMFYWVYFIIYNLLIWMRVWFVRRLTGFKMSMFTRRVYLPVLGCCCLSVIAPWIVTLLMPDGFLRLIVLTLVSTTCTAAVVLYVGMTRSERSAVLGKLSGVMRRIAHKSD